LGFGDLTVNSLTFSSESKVDYITLLTGDNGALVLFYFFFEGES